MMKMKIIGILVVMLLIATVALPISASLKIESRDIYKATNEKTIEEYLDFVPGELIVKFKEGTTLSFSPVDNIMNTGIPSIDNLNREFKVRSIEETILSVIKKPKNPELFESIGLDRIYTFYVDEDVDILDAVEAYEKDPCVEYAEPSGFGHGCVIPNDPHFSKQWGLHNTGQNGCEPDADIDAPEAWDITTGKNHIKIAIVDSGIDYYHEDLSDRIWVNPGEDIDNDGVVGDYGPPASGGDEDGLDNDGNGFIDDLIGWNFVKNNNNPMDDHTACHGTHCAGIAGAATNNNIGVAGVDWNCRLMAVKSMKSDNEIKWIHGARGVIYAADNGAHVISMSWGGYHYNQTLKDAIDYARVVGYCTLVAAMGNDNTNSLFYPAAYSNTFAVGATDCWDNRWSNSNYGSNYGSYIDVVAPGVDIYSTVCYNGYTWMTGTSMATPMVAGLAALIMSQKFGWNLGEIEGLIRKYADDLGASGFDQYYGWGRINAYRATKSAAVNYPVQQSNQQGSGQHFSSLLFLRLLERFPNAFPILRLLLRQ